MKELIVPTHKSDFTACNYLKNASDSEVKKHLPELLEWLQDINWPVATCVIDRVKKLNQELVSPIKQILKSSDSVWKYWIISSLLTCVEKEVVETLKPELTRLAQFPKKSDINEEVHIVSKELISLLK